MCAAGVLLTYRRHTQLLIGWDKLIDHSFAFLVKILRHLIPAISRALSMLLIGSQSHEEVLCSNFSRLWGGLGEEKYVKAPF